MRYPKVVFLASEGVVVIEADGWTRAVLEQDLPLLRATIYEEKDRYSQSPPYLALLAKLGELQSLLLKGGTFDHRVTVNRLTIAFGAIQKEIDECGIRDSVYRNQRLAEAALTVLGL